MSLVDLSRARNYLRVDADVDDKLIQCLVDGASEHVMGYLNRRIFASEDEMNAAIRTGGAGDSPMVINGAIQVAILKIAAELYANREESMQGAVNKVPLHALSLISWQRRRPGV
ncbi:head-tail connector protein [Paraburkholderia caribensis]|uniref:head-tail connector protein n=1 Tax=Paraburkholderia caribensis TaxID=75105 RepID=UPI001CC4B371|nr:head-tail connector protein [Paraburkholderia caribensis]